MPTVHSIHSVLSHTPVSSDPDLVQHKPTNENWERGSENAKKHLRIKSAGRLRRRYRIEYKKSVTLCVASMISLPLLSLMQLGKPRPHSQCGHLKLTCNPQLRSSFPKLSAVNETRQIRSVRSLAAINLEVCRFPTLRGQASLTSLAPLPPSHFVKILESLSLQVLQTLSTFKCSRPPQLLQPQLPTPPPHLSQNQTPQQQ